MTLKAFNHNHDDQGKLNISKSTYSKKKMTKKSSMTPTPFLLRVVMCLSYLEIARLGVVYAYDVLTQTGRSSVCLGSLNNGTCSEEQTYDLNLTAKFFAQASDACVYYTLIYVIDTLFAFSGYMSMYKHRMKHIFEHHIPGLIFTGCSALFHKNMSRDISSGKIIYPQSYITALHFLVVAGLVSQACEFMWVFRNLVSNPEAWHLKVIQRILGFALVTYLAAASNAVVVTFLHVKYTLQPWSYAEIIAFPVLCWLCMYIQPLYIMCHLKHLNRLFTSKEKNCKVSK